MEWRIRQGFVLPAAFILVAFISAGVNGLKCYSCAYIGGKDGGGSCSDPWRDYRDTLNVLTGPPKRECQQACVKMVVMQVNGHDSVIRTCGPPCNQTRTGNTLTTCCETDLCNGGLSVLLSNSGLTQRSLRIMVAVLLMKWINNLNIR